MAWRQGWGELDTLLIADAYGGGGATYWGPKTFTAGPHYVGGIVILFAIIALVRKRNVTVWALAISVLVDRKSTRLNSSHVASSYAVFCLKKKTHRQERRISA